MTNLKQAYDNSIFAAWDFSPPRPTDIGVASDLGPMVITCDMMYGMKKQRRLPSQIRQSSERSPYIHDPL